MEPLTARIGITVISNDPGEGELNDWIYMCKEKEEKNNSPGRMVCTRNGIDIALFSMTCLLYFGSIY